MVCNKKNATMDILFICLFILRVLYYVSIELEYKGHRQGTFNEGRARRGVFEAMSLLPPQHKWRC